MPPEAPATETYVDILFGTDPHDAADKPFVPYPLPDPDPADTGASDKPVKIYIMSGQSNMVGIGYVNGINSPRLSGSYYQGGQEIPQSDRRL